MDGDDQKKAVCNFLWGKEESVSQKCYIVAGRKYSMIVKVAQMGGEVREFSLGSGATVQNALDAADLELNGHALHVNSTPSSVTTVLEDGDVVTLTTKVEGGRI